MGKKRGRSTSGMSYTVNATMVHEIYAFGSIGSNVSTTIK